MISQGKATTDGASRKKSPSENVKGTMGGQRANSKGGEKESRK